MNEFNWLEIVQAGDKLFMPELHFEELRRQRGSFELNTDQRKIAAIIFLLQVIESLEHEHSAHQRLQNK